MIQHALFQAALFHKKHEGGLIQEQTTLVTPKPGNPIGDGAFS